jgi:hypothetical protein
MPLGDLWDGILLVIHVHAGALNNNITTTANVSAAVFWIRIHFIRIWIQHIRLNTDPDRDFDDQKLNKFTEEKKFHQKHLIYLSQDDFQAFSPQKRTSSTSKNGISKFVPTFVGHFCPPGSGYGFRIRIS